MPDLAARTGRPLRILMLIPQLGFGGAEKAFLRLARQLAASAEITIAVMDCPYGEVQAETDWIVAPPLRLDDATSPAQGPLGKARRWWRMLRRLRAMKAKYDVTISFLSGMNLLNALAGPRARTIVSERGSKRHDIGMSPRQRLIWTRLLDPLIYWRAGRVVAASEGLAQEIVTANPWAGPRVLAIPGTVQAEALVEAADLPVEPELMHLAEQETVVAFGRLHVQKGYDLLLSAFARVRVERPAARLLLIGAGPEEERLRTLAAGLGLRVGSTDGDVVLSGLRTDPLRYLRLGRVFALPSRYEGLPNALIEALAAGSPILAADCPWGPRAILSSSSLAEGSTLPGLPMRLEHGVLMPLPDAPGAVEAWAEAITHALAAPPPLRPNREARLAAIAPYDIARTCPVWLDLASAMARA
jgi:glycosyltransferase involved in cell wall biosynthesis